MARCAKFERALVQERVRAGLRNARRKGKQLGRPSKKLDCDKILRLRQSGLSWTDIANELGAGVATVIRAAGMPSMVQ
jgi:DNA invertase Pin-like site-specific DNA recombinase